jgi:AraC-like DNA-binding protein
LERGKVLYNSDHFKMEGQGRSTVQWALHPFECPLFEIYGILSLGYSKTGAGYRILRRNPEFSNIHVTMSGRGEALIGGRWQVISEGMAILSPRGVLHGTRAIQRTPWEFCWICYSESEGEPKKVSVREPTVVPIDPKPLTWAILSLYKESQQSRQRPVLDALVQLVHWYTQRISSPRNAPPVLWKLWEDIIQAPGQEWTVETMADRMNVSPRHLLRLCKRELGRSPHEQLASIRLTRASSLLQTSDMTLQTIAETVGYQDAFSLSKAFKSWSGLSPREYRAVLGREPPSAQTAPSFQ